MSSIIYKINGVDISTLRKVHNILDNPSKFWQVHGTLYPSVADGLVAWWKCEETSGTNVADSRDSYNGTVQNTTLSNYNGKIRKAQDWPGSGQYCFTVPYSANLNPANFSVALWLRVEGGAGSYRSAISSRNVSGSNCYGYIIYANSSNKLEFWMGDSTAFKKVTGPSYTLNAWHHCTATYNGTNMYFYVDGTKYGPTAATLSANTTRELRIAAGQNEGAINYEFNGPIDDVRIYNRALTETEASKLAAALT